MSWRISKKDTIFNHGESFLSPSYRYFVTLSLSIFKSLINFILYMDIHTKLILHENVCLQHVFLCCLRFQGGIMLSMFMGLRSMAYLPVESLKDQGCLWFPDMTAVDPYFLPLITAASIFLVVEVQPEGRGFEHNWERWLIGRATLNQFVKTKPLKVANVLYDD